MGRARLLRLVAAVALVCTLLLPFGANATIAIPFSNAQLVERSDFVVRADVTAQHSEWNADHSQIVTLTRLRVTGYLKGSGPEDLILRQLGGAVDGRISRVEGDAHFALGQDVVLFLRRGDGVVFLTAMAQAAFYVQWPSAGPATVRRDMRELAFMVPTSGSMTLVTRDNEPPQSLDEFLIQIRSLVGSGR